jgi:hypothetical protein
MFKIFDLLNPVQWVTFLFSIIGMIITALVFFIERRNRTRSILWFCFALNVFIKMIIGMSYGSSKDMGVEEITFINNYACGIFIYAFLVIGFESINKIIKTKSCKIWERRKNGL